MRFSSNDFDTTGTIATNSGNGKTGSSWADTYTLVKSIELRAFGNEEIKNSQGRAADRRSWVIRREDRTVIPNKMAYVVDNQIHNITNVRDYMNTRNWLVLDTVLYDNQAVYTAAPAPAYDSDAQLVFDRMPTLTDDEKTHINTFVIAEKADGNYALYDEFFVLSLGSTNGLIGFKSKSSTAYGGITWSVNGANFNGTTGYIDTGFIPSVDGVNYKLDDAYIATFVNNADNFTPNTVLVGCANSAAAGSQIFSDGSTKLSGRSNGGYSGSVAVIEGNRLYANKRINNISFSLFKGVSEYSLSKVSSATPNYSYYLGATNNAGGFLAPAAVELCTFVVAGGIGFNHSAHDTNVRQLLTNLGATI